MNKAKIFLKKIKNIVINNLSPDEAFRYRPIVKRIKKVLTNRDKLVEIGSGDVGVSPYLKNVKITGIDKKFLNVRTGNLDKIIYDGENIPFPNDHFDFLLNVDCLEHLEPKMRANLIREMLRTTKKEIFLVFPCGAAAAKMDKNLADLFYRHNHYHNIYLKEHLSNGLPEETEIEQYLILAAQANDKQISITSKNIMNVFVRKVYLYPKFKRKLSGNIFYFLFIIFLPLASLFNFGNCYWKFMDIKINK